MMIIRSLKDDIKLISKIVASRIFRYISFRTINESSLQNIKLDYLFLFI